jgi:hypothetical protein
MTVQTTCPACGAPLLYAGEQDVVVCGFCNTEIKVVSEGDDVRFRVLSQPEPQKDVLSQVYNPIIEGELPSEPPAVAVNAEPFGLQDSGAETFGMGPSSQEPFFTPPPVSSQPYQQPVVDAGAQVFPANPPARSMGGLPRWAVIAIAVLAGLCLLCVCAGAAAALIFRSSVGMY